MTAPDRNMDTEKAKLLRRTCIPFSAASGKCNLCNLLSGVNVEHAAMKRMVTGGNRPGQADAQEHVHRIAAGHIADTGVRVLVLDGCHFAGERVCARVGMNVGENG